MYEKYEIMDKNVVKYIPKKYLKGIYECYKDSDGYWAYAENGEGDIEEYYFTATGSHIAHGETIQEFLSDIRTLVTMVKYTEEQEKRQKTWDIMHK